MVSAVAVAAAATKIVVFVVGTIGAAVVEADVIGPVVATRVCTITVPGSPLAVGGT